MAYGVSDIGPVQYYAGQNQLRQEQLLNLMRLLAGLKQWQQQQGLAQEQWQFEKTEKWPVEKAYKEAQALYMLRGPQSSTREEIEARKQLAEILYQNNVINEAQKQEIIAGAEPFIIPQELRPKIARFLGIPEKIIGSLPLTEQKKFYETWQQYLRAGMSAAPNLELNRYKFQTAQLEKMEENIQARLKQIDDLLKTQYSPEKYIEMITGKILETVMGSAGSELPPNLSDADKQKIMQEIEKKKQDIRQNAAIIAPQVYQMEKEALLREKQQLETQLKIINMLRGEAVRGVPFEFPSELIQQVVSPSQVVNQPSQGTGMPTRDTLLETMDLTPALDKNGKPIVIGNYVQLQNGGGVRVDIWESKTRRKATEKW